MNHRCYSCQDVVREFRTEAELLRHRALRHSDLKGYGAPGDLKPKPAGKSWEDVYAALSWDADLLEDQINELTAKRDAIEEMMDVVRERGGLNHEGKAPKEKAAAESKAKKPAANKPAAKKKAAARKSVATPAKGNSPAKPDSSKVGLSPFKGGTPPPGKPHWDSRSGRWTATMPVKRGKVQPRPVASAKQDAVDGKKEKPVADLYQPDQQDRYIIPPPADLPSAEGSVDHVLELCMETRPGASQRWDNNRIEGLSDEELRQRIAYELGEPAGEIKGPDWRALWKKDKGQVELSVVATDNLGVHHAEKFSGQALVDKVREVRGIDVPAAPAKKAM